MTDPFNQTLSGMKLPTQALANRSQCCIDPGGLRIRAVRLPVKIGPGPHQVIKFQFVLGGLSAHLFFFFVAGTSPSLRMKGGAQKMLEIPSPPVLYPTLG